MTAYNKEGQEWCKFTLTEVQHVPKAAFNLINETKLMMNGWTMTGKGDAIIFSKPKTDLQLVFDIIVRTKRRQLFGMYISRRTEGEVANAAQTEATETVTKMSIKQAHAKFGHCDETATRAIAKDIGYEISRGTLGPCEACTVAKAKQKNIPKNVKHDKANVNNGRVYLDIATIKAPPNVKVSKPNWHMIVDERTGLKTSDFYPKKNEMVEPTCELFHKWRDEGKPVTKLRMDNAGENKLLEQRMKSADWKLNPDIEYTARGTPQQNHLVEVGFATIANRGRAMMIAANIPLEKRYVVCHRAFETATKLDGLIVVTIDGKAQSWYKHFGMENPPFLAHLRTWGEAGTVKIKNKGTPKVGDRGVQCMFVGYAPGHAGDCYQILNWQTKMIMETRDVIWLRCMYFQRPSILPELVTTPNNDDDL